MSDIFAPAEIGAPMGFYTAAPFLGPGESNRGGGDLERELIFGLQQSAAPSSRASSTSTSTGAGRGMCSSCTCVPSLTVLRPALTRPYRALDSWAAIELVALVFFVPETYLPAILLIKAKRLRKTGRAEVKAPMELSEKSIPRVIATSCTRPFRESLPGASFVR